VTESVRAATGTGSRLGCGGSSVTQTSSTELQTLHDHLDALDHDLLVVGKPVDDLQSLLGEVIAVLDKPKRLSDDLKAIADVLSKIQSICSDAAWMPEVGEAAGAMSKLLLPLVKTPPPGGAIGETRTSLNEIDVLLSPLKNRLKEAQGAVERAQAPIHRVELDVRRLVNGTGSLVRRYGSQAPENVERCAAGFNRGIVHAATELRQGRETVVKHLNDFQAPLGQIEAAFHRAAAYLDAIEQVSHELGTYATAVRKITDGVNRASAYGRKKVEDLFSLAGRLAHPGLYQKVKQELDDANRWVNQMMGKVTRMAMDPVRREVDQLESRLRDEVARIPEVQALEEALALVQKQVEELEDEIVDTLSGECADVLGT
jgi:hypothetical protein